MRNIKLFIFVAAIAALVIASILLPVGDWISSLIRFAETAGALGMVVYGLAYVSATVLMVPGLILTLGAGFLYGPFYGLLLVSPASVIGATLAFLLGRYALRSFVQEKVSSRPKFSTIDHAIGRKGFRIVAFLRLSPIFPFNLLNYGLGLTRVSLTKYVLASFLGMLPGTFMYVYFGSAAESFAQIATGGAKESSIARWMLYFVGLLATVMVTVIITRIAKKALKQELGKEQTNAQS